MRRLSGALATVSALSLAIVGCDRGLGPDVAATAGDMQLSIEDAAQILAPVSSLPNDVGVAEAALDFWIDYTLLAWVVNQDGALGELDVSAIVEQERSRQMVLQLREQVIQIDTAITDDELRAAFEEAPPGEEIRARHVLVSVPAGSTVEQQDSLRAVAEEIRERAVGGEDFGRLAGQYSDDPGSAIEGGDLGFFGRGMMVPPFEAAAFALEPGEISDIVESSFGLHLILLEERRGPALEDIAEDFRVQLQAEREMVAESMYLAQIEEPANVRIGEGAIVLVRQISESPDDGLSSGEGSRPLAIWETGELPAEEYREFVVRQPREVQQQIAVAQDAQLEAMLHDLARDRLLLEEVGKAGIEVTEEEEAAIVADVLDQYVVIAGFLELDSLEVEEGSNLAERVDREAKAVLGRVVANEVDLIPLGPLAPPLRALYEPRTGEDAAERIVARVAELREGGGADALDLSQPPGLPTAAPPAELPSDAEPPP